MSAPLVFPVGRQLAVSRGRLGPDGEPDRDDVVAFVDRGWDTVQLSGPAFTLWSAGHGHPEAPDDVRWTTDDARALCAAWGMGAEQTEQAWAELVDTGTVSTVADDPAARDDWARRHRLVPLVLGLGNTAEEPGVFTVGLPEQPLLAVSVPMFEVWAAGHGFDDLGSVVRWYADQAVTAGQSDPAVTDPERLLAAVVGSLHRFLTVRAAHLDVAAHLDDGAHPDDGVTA